MPDAPLGYLPALLLGLLQGVTEFLPVSSSGHLSLARHLGLCDPDGHAGAVAFDILLHLATSLVVLRAFWSEIAALLRRDRIALLYVLLGTVPAGLTGLLFAPELVTLRESPAAVSGALLVTALFLFLTDRAPLRQGEIGQLSPGRVLLVGFAQALAIVPGVSRSGLTIAGGVAAGLGRAAAVRFAFFLFLPAIVLASGHDIWHHGAEWSALPPGPAALGFAAAVAAGHASLFLLRRLVTGQRLWYFALYCAAAGAAGLVYFLLLRG